MGQENVCQKIWTLVLISIVSQATSASAVLDTACQTEPSLESLCGSIRLPGSGQEIQLVPVPLRNSPQTPLALLKSFGTWNFVCTYPGSVPSGTTVKNENNLGTTTGATSLRNSAITSYPTTSSELSTIAETLITLDRSRTPSEPGVVVGGNWPSQSTPATTTPHDTVVTTDTDEQSPSTSTHTTRRMSATEAAYVTTDASGSPQSTSVYDTTRTSTPERTTTDLPESTTSSGRYSTTTEPIDVTTDASGSPQSTSVYDTTRTSTPERTTTDLPDSTTSSGRSSTPTKTNEVTTGSSNAPTTTTGQFGTCPSGFVSFGDKCYFFPPAHLTSYMNYADAEDFCTDVVSAGLADDSATLLTINSLEENQFLMSHLAGVQDTVDIVGSDGVWVDCDLNGRFDCNLDYDSLPYYDYYSGK
ncbi:mucin-5AC-like [Strongylocentrotus purpuratus]|uniref:C-type lectin domain-containing protein n=1 Tax=Strongylocentrotus purpuratus TaxID=7668 RepID=A0A7M7NUD3_STRPU|nr:mucin-5AC-like [Strongylocentrotus purpuratus]